MAADEDDGVAEAFERALALVERHLDAAEDEAGDLNQFVPVAMIEAAVNRAVDVAGHQDVAALLRDLADQIMKDFGGEAVN